MEHIENLAAARLRAQRKAELEANVQYVEALEGEGDYWLSITDAARVCRVQDVTLRRAINRGNLPVRKLPAGQNKRTRFVRASDLPRAGYPIIDESATITTEIGKADILSIPRQQQEIMAVQRRLMEQYTGLLADLERFTAQLHHLGQQAEALHGAVGAVREELTQQLSQLTARHEGDLTALRLALQQAETQTQERLQQQADSYQEALATLRSDLSGDLENKLQQIQKRLDTFIEEQQQALQSHKQTVSDLLEQAERTTNERFHTLDQQGTATATALSTLQEQTKALTTSLSTLQQQVADLETREEAAATAFESYTQGAQQELGRLAGELSSFQGEQDRLREQLVESTKRQEELAEQLAASEQRQQALSGRVSEQERRLTEQDRQYQDLLATIEEMKQQRAKPEAQRKSQGTRRKKGTL